MLHTALTSRLCGSSLLASSTLLAATPVFNHVQARGAARGSRKREKKRVKRRLGHTSYSKTGEEVFNREDQASKKKLSQKQKKQEEEESQQVFKIPEGNTKKKTVDFTNPNSVRQGLQEMLSAPVQPPLGRKVELKSSAQLGLPPKIEYNNEKKPKTETKQKKSDDDDDSENPFTEDQEAEMKKVVFSDRKDYINYQIKVLQEKAKKEEKISAHR